MNDTKIEPFTTSPLAMSLPGVADFTATGLTLRTGLSVDAYRELGRSLVAMKRMVGVYLSDYAREGVAKVGEAGARDVWGQLEMEFGDATARQLEMALSMPSLPALEDRTAGLTDEHYFVAARECEDTETQIRWLATAVDAGLSPQQLQLSIRAGEVRRAKPLPGGTRVSFPSMYRVASEFRLFAKEADPENYDEATRAEVLKVLGPIEEFVRRVRG